jgi:5-methylthioadenosine/S-adenosylhomocysteine deaminase
MKAKLGRKAMADFGVGRRKVLKAAGVAVAAGALPGLVPGLMPGLGGEALAANGTGRILIKGGCVLSLDPGIGDFDKADVLIEGKKIATVGRDLKAEGASVIDATGTIVLPGFVDTHHHLY